MQRIKVLTAMALVLFAAAQYGPSASARQARSTANPNASALRIKILSNRADLVSGGDAYVEILLPRRTTASGLSVRLGGRDVTRSFAKRRNGRVLGVVDHLRVGRNVLRARLRDGRAAELTITNHPKGGPVFSGPQVQPWICDTQTQGLGAPRDKQCNVKPVYVFKYMPVTGIGECAMGTLVCVSGLSDYDPNDPPPAETIATTTTDQGNTVPYIVRVERGVIDRGFYEIAILFQPGKPWKPWDPQPGWNGKVLFPFGAGGEPAHKQIANQPVLSHPALSRGFAVAATAMAHNSQGFNDVVQAEGVMMLKEHLIETYGEVRYSIGTGCSGGSMTQYELASNYPGLLDGIMPACSFPDVMTTYTSMADCKLIHHYFIETSPYLWTPAQEAAAIGYPTPGTCNTESGRADSYVSPTGGADCADYPWAYRPDTNPRGVRCTVPDYGIATWGRRPRSAWGPIEKRIGRGFAQMPYDTVGIQWGLKALIDGDILPEQFVDLNEKIGGLDVDANFQAARSKGDPGAIEIAYRSGRFTNGRQMAKVPHIELRGSSNAEEHYDWQSFQTRARLVRDNKQAGNMVYWRSNGPLVPNPLMNAEAFRLMDRWLGAIKADHSNLPLETKVLRDKPLDAADGCWFGNLKVSDPVLCDVLVPYFREPRFIAGGPVTADVAKCQLEPLKRSDYAFMPVPFTDDQWDRLRATFPTGVCDYSRPGMYQQPPDGPWMTYTGGPGGRVLGSPPASTPTKAIR
jgi:hypothetical protein